MVDSEHDDIVPSADRRTARSSDGADWTRGSRFIPNDGEPDTCVQKIVQQRLAGTPVLFNARCGIFLFASLMVMFVALGVVLWTAADEVVAYSRAYGPDEFKGTAIKEDRARWNNEVRVLTIKVEKDMVQPLHVQYHLSGFYQNHRRYRKSVSWAQLAGDLNADVSSDCALWLHDAQGRTWYPCGLIGRSVFSDYFMIYRKDEDTSEWRKVDIKTSRDRLIGSSLRVEKLFNQPTNDSLEDNTKNFWIYFQFPPQRCLPKLTSAVIGGLKDGDTDTIKQLYVANVSTGQPDCNIAAKTCKFASSSDAPGTPCPSDMTTVSVPDFGVSSPHFINWFYLAAFPDFHKLWGIIEEDIPAGTELKVVIFDNFDVASFKGKKKFVITTTNWIGTNDYGIAIAYFVTAGFCLLATLYLTYIWVKRPRLESIALDFVQPS